MSICRFNNQEPTTKDQRPTTKAHGSATRARIDLDLAALVPALGALQPQLPAALAGANRERGRRLVLYPGDLQSPAAVDGPGEPVALALVLQVLPETFIGPAAGVINDRISRKRVMIAADLARMVIVFAMLLVRSRSTVWLVYPLLLLETLMAAFFEPARTSVIPNVAAREDVLVANTLSSATWSVNLLVGASVGGVVAALFGRDAVFVLNALSFLVSAILIRGMRFEEPHAQGAAPLRLRDAVDLSPVIEGIRYVRRDRRLLAAVCAKAGELMIGPSWVLFTVMGNGYFHVHVRGINRRS